MNVTYTYSIADDTLNGTWNRQHLISAIVNSNHIAHIFVDAVEVDGNIEITFTEALTTGEEAYLTYLVSQHDGSQIIYTFDTHVSNCVRGDLMRHERIPQQNLPRYNQSPLDVYEISEEGVIYKVLFAVNSDCIYVQIEVDGQDIFPGSNGFLLSEFRGLEAIGVSSKSPTRTHISAELVELKRRTWVWIPPEPLHLSSSLKMKMKSSNNSSNRYIVGGIATRRLA